MKFGQWLRRYWPETLLFMAVALPWLSLFALGLVWPDWGEVVAGFKAGNVTWNRALGPQPGQPGCKVPAEVLREHGY
jgi:hypothetical protein